MAEQTANSRDVSPLINGLQDALGSGISDAEVRSGGSSNANNHDADAKLGADSGRTTDRTNIHQIAYMGRSTKNFVRDGLADLCHASTVRNQNHGITGLVVYDGKRFMQVIEGEVDAVCRLMSRIVIDDRHDSITYLMNGPITAPAFETWGLSCVGFNENRTRTQLLADVKNSVRNVANPTLAAAFIGFASLAN